ncbi:hypothetical protein ACFL2K_03095, partial [Candidatus Margulisiibacteriota bacterium]
ENQGLKNNIRKLYSFFNASYVLKKENIIKNIERIKKIEKIIETNIKEMDINRHSIKRWFFQPFSLRGNNSHRLMLEKFCDKKEIFNIFFNPAYRKKTFKGKVIDGGSDTAMTRFEALCLQPSDFVTKYGHYFKIVEQMLKTDNYITNNRDNLTDNDYYLLECRIKDCIYVASLFRKNHKQFIVDNIKVLENILNNQTIMGYKVPKEIIKYFCCENESNKFEILGKNHGALLKNIKRYWLKKNKKNQQFSRELRCN